MKSSPNLQQFVLQLVTKHGIAIDQTGAYLRLDLADGSPGLRLILENIGASRIALSAQIHLLNQWVADPEIVLWTGADDAWAPIEVNQVLGGWQGYATVDAHGNLEDFSNPQGQTALADLAEEVAANLMNQGWLEHGLRASEAQPNYTLEEMLARGYIIVCLVLPDVRLETDELPDAPCWLDEDVAQPDSPPDVETLWRWVDEQGLCMATDGCWTEPDGVCEHGYQSWLLELGLI